MTKPQQQAIPEKGMSRRRRTSSLSARRAAKGRAQKTNRKQTVRQAGRRRGGH